MVTMYVYTVQSQHVVQSQQVESRRLSNSLNRGETNTEHLLSSGTRKTVRLNSREPPHSDNTRFNNNSTGLKSAAAEAHSRVQGAELTQQHG